jgi:glucose-1-phosphate cytidylyltransferase
VTPLRSDISDWRITFVDTGMSTSIGERLRRVRPYLGDDEMFLANYGDVLTDAPMNDIIGRVRASDAAASLLAVKPQASFHVVRFDEDSRISEIHPVSDLPLRENGGYFVLRQDVFDVLGENEDLVGDAFGRLAAQGRLLAIPHDGFWAPMDTLKERQYLEDLHHRGQAPWELWETSAPTRLLQPLSGQVPAQAVPVERAS